MQNYRGWTAGAFVCALAGTSFGGPISPGDIVFLSGQLNNASIQFLDYEALAVTQLVNAPGKRLSALEIDQSGNFYAVNANTPLVLGASSITRFAYGDLFAPLSGGSEATFADQLVLGGLLRAPGEAVFDPATNQLIYPNNNQNLQNTAAEHMGIIGVNVTTGVIQTLALDPTNLGNFDQRPNFRQPNGITTDPTGTANYLFVSPEGSLFDVPTIVPGGGGLQGGTLWRLNGEAAGSGATQVKDLAAPDVVAAIGRGLGFELSMEAIPGTNSILVTDAGDGNGVGCGIYRIDLNPDGSYNSIHTILNETLYPAMAQPGDIVYNPYTDKFVVSSFSNGANVGDFMFEMNADGTGISVLVPNMRATDFVIVTNNIPTPGGIALAGAALLVSFRRRRA